MAALDQPVIELYDKAGARLDWLRAPVSVRATPRWLEVGDATIVVQPNDYRAALLREPGARVQISLRGGHVLGGPVTSWSTKGPRDEQWTFTVTDDAAALDRVLCLPDPTKPLDQQPAGANTRAGRLESVVKSFVAANAPILGMPIDIATDQGRGPNVTIAARWQPVSEVVVPHLRAAGLGLSVVWQPGTNRLLLDVVEQRTYPIQLSVESRTVTDYQISASAPIVTRTYLGVADGTTFTQATNTAAEAAWGPFLRGSTFRAAANVDEASTNGSEALNDGGAKSGLSVTLSETPYVRYGGVRGLRVGDKATLRIGDVEVTDVVREAVIDWKTGSALTIQPGVGAWENSPAFALADAVRRMGATVRRYVNR